MSKFSPDLHRLDRLEEDAGVNGGGLRLTLLTLVGLVEGELAAEDFEPGVLEEAAERSRRSEELARLTRSALFAARGQEDEETLALALARADRRDALGFDHQDCASDRYAAVCTCLTVALDELPDADRGAVLARAAELHLPPRGYAEWRAEHPSEDRPEGVKSVEDEQRALPAAPALLALPPASEPPDGLAPDRPLPGESTVAPDFVPAGRSYPGTAFRKKDQGPWWAPNGVSIFGSDHR